MASSPARRAATALRTGAAPPARRPQAAPRAARAQSAVCCLRVFRKRSSIRPAPSRGRRRRARRGCGRRRRRDRLPSVGWAGRTSTRPARALQQPLERAGPFRDRRPQVDRRDGGLEAGAQLGQRRQAGLGARRQAGERRLVQPETAQRLQLAGERRAGFKRRAERIRGDRRPERRGGLDLRRGRVQLLGGVVQRRLERRDALLGRRASTRSASCASCSRSSAIEALQAGDVDGACPSSEPSRPAISSIRVAMPASAGSVAPLPPLLLQRLDLARQLAEPGLQRLARLGRPAAGRRLLRARRAGSALPRAQAGSPPAAGWLRNSAIACSSAGDLLLQRRDIHAGLLACRLAQRLDLAPERSPARPKRLQRRRPRRGTHPDSPCVSSAIRRPPPIRPPRIAAASSAGNGRAAALPDGLGRRDRVWPVMLRLSVASVGRGHRLVLPCRLAWSGSGSAAAVVIGAGLRRRRRLARRPARPPPRRRCASARPARPPRPGGR